MGPPSVGTIVLINFPFSNLSASKLRPALVLAEAGRQDWVMCQITSNPYSDPGSVEIRDSDFISGSLQRISYARPGKLFTGHISIIEREVGKLTDEKLQEITSSVIDIFRTDS